jgi:hypothetical protein
MRQRLALLATLVLGLVSVVAPAQTSANKAVIVRRAFVERSCQRGQLPCPAALSSCCGWRRDSIPRHPGSGTALRAPDQALYDQNWQVVVPDGCTVEGSCRVRIFGAT